MRKVIRYIVLCFAVLYGSFTIWAQQQPLSTKIPEDSLSTSMGYSYRYKLQKAAQLDSLGRYKESVQLYNEALDEYKEYNIYRQQQMADHLENLYETENKEKQIEYLKETVRLKQIQNILLFIFCVLTAVTLLFLFGFLSYRLRTILQRAARKENETSIARLEKERKDLQTHLHDVETENAKKELLAESLLVDYKNKVIKDFGSFLIENPDLNKYKQELEHILGNSNSQEACAGIINTGIQDVHPQFYSRLQQKANNGLTKLDLEYCRMIFLGMTSKEIADVLKINPRSVRVGKYRLKQKLGLNKTDDLSEFITSR